MCPFQCLLAGCPDFSSEVIAAAGTVLARKEADPGLTQTLARVADLRSSHLCNASFYFDSGLLFGLFHENSRREKRKIKNLKPKTQEFFP